MKPSILIFLNRYLPGYKAGGPIQTIANMVNAIGDRCDFHIVTTDRDLGDTIPYENIQPGVWMEVGKAKVCYLPPGQQNWRQYRKILAETRFDLLYCQSFFDPKFTLLPIVTLTLSRKRNIPVLIAPRGEFGRGALAHKKLKKKVFLFVFKTFLTRLRSFFSHVSSPDEADAVWRILGSRKSFVALNFNAQERISESDIRITEQDALRLAFLGRIDIQKNVDYALRLLAMVKAPVAFDIYGPLQDAAYVEHCREIAARLPAHIKVCFKGTLPHPEVLPTLVGYDLFLYPTKNENFGHVIHEALRAGVPVLISDQTPWHEVNQRKAGGEWPLDSPEEFARFIDAYAGMPVEERRIMHQNALQYGIAVSQDRAVADTTINMFESLLKTTIE